MLIAKKNCEGIASRLLCRVLYPSCFRISDRYDEGGEYGMKMTTVEDKAKHKFQRIPRM